MKSALRNGRITPPTSTHAAAARQRQLLHEVTKIQTQLDDPARVLRYPTTSAYDEWQAGAKHAMKLFRAEAEQLTDWIAQQHESAETLLADAYAVLQTLEDEVDFEPNETELMARLGRYFARERKFA